MTRAIRNCGPSSKCSMPCRKSSGRTCSKRSKSFSRIFNGSKLLCGKTGLRLGPPFGTVANPIAKMMAEHDNAGELLKQMRSASRGYTLPDDACPNYAALYRGLEEFEQDLHTHVRLENNILFPRAVEQERSAGGGRSAAS